MFAIYKKEIKSYLNSVIGWLFISLTLFVQGISFLMSNLVSASPYITYALSATMFILLFTVPILTMKTLAEERKLKTDQMILTYPVSIVKVVFGKYLALCTLFFVVSAVTCTYPLILSGYGAVPIKQSFTAIFGVFLYGCALIAIGVFVSSITESQVIAAIIGIITLFVGFIAGDIASAVEQKISPLSKVLKGLDIYAPTESCLNGYIELRNVVYYISLIVLFLFFTTQSIQKKKWNFSLKRISDVVYSVGFIAMALVIVIFTNLTIGKISENNSATTLDMTDEKLYNLSDEMKKYLDGVKGDVSIYLLYNGEKIDSVIEKSLKNIDNYSKHVKLVYKDVTKNPGFYSRYTEEVPNVNSIIIVNDSTNKSKVIDYYDLLESNVDYMSLSATTEGYDCEEWVATGINYVLSENNAVVGHVSGHGEKELDASFVESIEKMNAKYVSINLINTDIDKDKYQAIVLGAPEKDYTKEESEKIINFIDNGGKVLMITNGDFFITYEENRKKEEMVNYESIANHYGVGVYHGIALELDESRMYNNPMGILLKDGQGVGDTLDNYVLFENSQGLYYLDDEETYNAEKYRYTSVFETSNNALIRSDLAGDTTDFKKEEGDLEGSFPVVISVEEINEDTKYKEYISEESEVFKGANLTIVGSAYAFSEFCDELVAGTNMQFFKNIFNRFGIDKEQKINIPTKYIMYKNLTVDNQNVYMLGMFVAVIVPVIILIIGIVKWLRRRRL
ncbi:MAG: Gldg family protein [Lachnospiraceae bacterium]|nr:Gldg family protein [Lachnospiraceae bacterium]